MSLSNRSEAGYAQMRGYWDQFLSKTRYVEEKDDRWHYPAAGYVELIVDGYDRH